MDNESYQDKIDYTVLVFVDTGTQTKRKVRSALCSYLIYCSNHFMTRFDSNAACIFAICVWYLYKINKNSTNYSPKSSACGGQVFLKMYYFSACGGQNQGGLCVEWGGLAKTEPIGGQIFKFVKNSNMKIQDWRTNYTRYSKKILVVSLLLSSDIYLSEGVCMR